MKYQNLVKERNELMSGLKYVTAQIKMADMAVNRVHVPYGNFPNPFKVVQEQLLDRKKLQAKYRKLSKEIGLTINNENQYRLAMMGASQEIIDTNVHSDVYELFVRQGH